MHTPWLQLKQPPGQPSSAYEKTHRRPAPQPAARRPLILRPLRQLLLQLLQRLLCSLEPVLGRS